MNANWLKFLPGFLRKRLEGRHGLQAAMGNTAWLMTDKVMRLVLGLVVTVWMARVFGPKVFGQYSFALAYVALFTSIAALGLDKVVVRDLVRAVDGRERIIGSAALLKFLGAVFAILACNLTALLVVPDNQETRLLVAIISLGLLFKVFDVVDFWFQSQVASRYVVMARLPALLVFFVLRVFLLLGTFSLSFFAWAYTLEILFAGVGLLIVYSVQGKRIFEWRPAVDNAVALIRECWPLIFAGLSVMLYMKIDVVMLGSMSGDVAAGVYSAATRLTEGFYFIPMIIASSIMPMLVRAREAGTGPYMDGLSRLYLIMVRISLGITIPLALFAPSLIGLLYGAEYGESSGVLRIHIWASVAVFLGVASSQFLTLEGLQKLSLYRTLTGLVINIVLNLLLIPEHGANGAAIATLVSYFIATFSIMIPRKGMQQGVLMLQAMNPLAVLGLKGNSSI
jgi:PST family polysaccharide transporter